MVGKFDPEHLTYIPTGRRTDDGSWWRKTFGNTRFGLYWGRPIVRTSSALTYTGPTTSVTVPKGFECDLGTLPGPLGALVRLCVRLRIIPEPLAVAAVLHDYLWALADGADNPSQAYREADALFYDALLTRGHPKWFARIAWATVRFAAEVKLWARTLR